MSGFCELPFTMQYLMHYKYRLINPNDCIHLEDNLLKSFLYYKCNAEAETT